MTETERFYVEQNRLRGNMMRHLKNVGLAEEVMRLTPPRWVDGAPLTYLEDVDKGIQQLVKRLRRDKKFSEFVLTI